ncbi:class I SAM-dependent methyltransferase [Rhodococcus sp. NPDC059969]|uniref:class I SAM-dependent methyltransferase n=1 Tax=Rhodococcus sp. NPDC059969 TaxID=3347018 RepID=UPI00366DA0BE
MTRGNWNGATYSTLAEQLSPASLEALRSIGHVSTVYDVCAGTGNFALPAAQRGMTVHALDLSASQLEAARERWIPRPGITEPTFTIGDAQSLPWPDSSADACVSIFGIIFCPDPAIALAEMMRVTRPGGKICVATWSENGWAAALRREAASAWKGITPLPTTWARSSEFEKAAAGLESVSSSCHVLEWQLPAGSDPIEELCDQAPALKNFREAVRETGSWASMSAHLRSTLAPYLRSSATGPVATSEYVLHVGTVPKPRTAPLRTRG